VEPSSIFLYFQAEFEYFAEELRGWSGEFQYIFNVLIVVLLFSFQI
jgi:hypothetical protein